MSVFAVWDPVLTLMGLVLLGIPAAVFWVLFLAAIVRRPRK